MAEQDSSWLQSVKESVVDRRQGGESDETDAAGVDDTTTDGGTQAVSKDDVEAASAQLADVRKERDRLRSELQTKREQIKEQDQRLRDLEGSLAELQGVVEANAEGDLTRRAEVESDVEAVVAFVSTYNRMLDEWNETLQKVKTFSEEVDSSTTDVSADIQAVREESQQVTESITEIAEGANQQSDELSGVAQEMSTLSATIEEVAASANEVASMSERAVDRSQQSQQAASSAVDRLETMEDQTTETMEHIETLQQRVSDIEEIAEFINEVAEQTNMLALNANIEAARAGEKGDGFGVVANEVKQLASETKEATGRIEQSVSEVREQTDRTVSDMRKTSATVTETRDAVTEALEGLDAVAKVIEDVNHNVQEVDNATDQQARSTQKVSSQIDDVSEISDGMTGEARKVSDAASSQHEALTDVTTAVDDLSQRAKELETTSSEFETGRREKRVIRDSDTVVKFHHAMTGGKALLLQDMAAEFEQQTEGIRLQPISMGSYPAALDSVLDADSHEDVPALTQVYDIGTAQAREHDSFQPVQQIMDNSVIERLVDSVREYYEMDGQLYSIPFNSSNPILCLNREQFEAAGLDPTDPPETFADIEQVSRQLVEHSDCRYGLTFAIYSWYVEQWFSEAGQVLFDAENGRAGDPTAAYLDSEFGQNLFEWWVEMETEGLYHNPGIHGHSAALNAFHDERSGMFIGSTASLNRIQAGAAFPVETAYYPVQEERNGVVVGGASLWVKDGLDPEIESAVCEFLGWLLEPEQQATWHRETGYFPVVSGAIDQLQSEGWFEQNPQFATAFRQFRESTDSPATNGAQFRSFDQVRSIIHEGRAAMESTGDVTPTLAEMNAEVEELLQPSEKR